MISGYPPPFTTPPMIVVPLAIPPGTVLGPSQASLAQIVSKVLAFDDASQRFYGDHADAANTRLTRVYRAPYEIPADLV